MSRRPNVVIVGGGIYGLICAYAFGKYDVNLKVVEPGIIGGDILYHGYQYIERRQSIVDMMEEIEVAFSPFSMSGGVLLKESVIKYPDDFKAIPYPQRERIKKDYYRKTRMKEPQDREYKNSLIDPPCGKPKSAIRTDPDMFVEALTENIYESGGRFVREAVGAVGINKLITKRVHVPYDYIIFTIPLWELDRMVYWQVPTALAICSNTIMVSSKYTGNIIWDYVVTPYTPGGCIYRFTYLGGDIYSVEVSGSLNKRIVDVCSDLNYLFRDMWCICGVQERLGGHLLSIDLEEGEDIYWPTRIMPIGKYTKWKNDYTIDNALEDSMRIGNLWFKGLEKDD